MKKQLLQIIVGLTLMPHGGVKAAEADNSAATNTAPAQKPNVVYILADDLGYGDVHCLNPERGKIATPNIDRFAAQGMVFTDAHSSSAVCSP